MKAEGRTENSGSVQLHGRAQVTRPKCIISIQSLNFASLLIVYMPPKPTCKVVKREGQRGARIDPRGCKVRTTKDAQGNKKKETKQGNEKIKQILDQRLNDSKKTCGFRYSLLLPTPWAWCPRHRAAVPDACACTGGRAAGGGTW